MTVQPLKTSPLPTDAPPQFSVPPGGWNDQMLSYTRVHHMQLSIMADNKANMLITISSIVITLSVHSLVEPSERWPAAVLIGFSLLSILFAALTTMPKVRPSGQSRRPPPSANDPRFNVLFFSDFTRLDYPGFLEAMEQAMASPSRAYEAQLRELYLLGTYLDSRKYRYVRIGYLCFIIGLMLSALIWVDMAFF